MYLVSYTSAMHGALAAVVEKVFIALQVLPLGEGKTQVLMDYYVHPSKASPMLKYLVYSPGHSIDAGQQFRAHVVAHACLHGPETFGSAGG